MGFFFHLKYQAERASHSEGTRRISGEAEGPRHRDDSAELHSLRTGESEYTQVGTLQEAGIEEGENNKK